MPAMPSMPSMPSMPAMPAMPSMPSIPSIPGLRKGNNEEMAADGTVPLPTEGRPVGGMAAPGTVATGPVGVGMDEEDKSRYIRYGPTNAINNMEIMVLNFKCTNIFQSTNSNLALNIISNF